MARAFDDRSCGDSPETIPDNTKIPLDTAPMMPKNADGSGIGSPNMVRGAQSPFGETNPNPASPPLTSSAGGGGGGGDCGACRIPYYSG